MRVIPEVKINRALEYVGRPWYLHTTLRSPVGDYELAITMPRGDDGHFDAADVASSFEAMGGALRRLIKEKGQ